MIGQIETVVGRHHRIAVDHEPLGQRPLPENRAVVDARADQCVEHRVLVGLVSDVPERAKDSSSRRDGDFRHGYEQRIGEELRQIGRSGQLVRGLRIVVGTMERMTPGVHPRRHRFDYLALGPTALCPAAAGRAALPTPPPPLPHRWRQAPHRPGYPPDECDAGLLDQRRDARPASPPPPTGGEPGPLPADQRIGNRNVTSEP